MLKGIILTCTALLISGCASSYMVKSEKTALSPEAGKATLVLMRPSLLGGAIQSSVYLVAPDQKGQEFIGVVSSKTKIAYSVAPGHHLFMVIAENADFMDADLEADKTYYALVSPRIGIWKARFSLLPIHADKDAKYNLYSSEFKDWDAATDLVEKSATADDWYRDVKSSVDEKRDDYLMKWNGRTAEDKAELYLHAVDGVR